MNGLVFSVIIPTFNRRTELLECLGSLAGQSLPKTMFEVIVVDDGSSDGTESVVSQLKWEFRLTYVKQENTGPSEARNKGASTANASILAFTEDDVIVRPDWLSNARIALERRNLDLLEGRTLYRGTETDVRRFEPEQRPSFIPCNLFVKASLFKELGGYSRDYFDVSTGLYFREDADFGFRALANGSHCGIASDVIVEHPVQFQSVESCSRHVRRYVFDPLLYKRHPEQYRRLIEVKTIAGITIHRPQHYVALVYALAMIGGVVGLLTGKMFVLIVSVMAMIFCTLAFRYKYRAKLTLDFAGLVDSVRFVVVPFHYLHAFVRGCFKFKSCGAMV